MKQLLTIPERFWSKVQKGPDCWTWIASTDTAGYGQFNLYRPGQSRNVIRKAHRIAWELTKGAIPRGAHVLHRCDTPRCVNPEHLFLGDQAANMRDMCRKGRHANAVKTHCPSGHEYTEANTYTYRDGRRSCRICTRASQRAYKARQREVTP